MDESPVRIIYEDRQLLVVAKPPGWLSQPGGSGRPDVLSWAAGRLAAERGRPAAWVGLCHRLDLPAGGLMVLAKTSKAASRLSRQFRERSVDKAYLALVLGRAPESGDLRDVLARDGRVSRRAEGGEPGTEARLSFRLASSGLVDGRPASLLEVDLLTGLRHQIRAQLSLAGHPIFGDELYGGPRRPAGAPSIGLWSTALALDHPVGGRRLAFREPPPDIWPFSRLRPKAGF